MRIGTAFALLLVLTATTVLPADEPRSAAHQAYAKSLWEYVTKTVDYSKWKQADEARPLDLGPPCCRDAVTYLNSVAQQAGMPHGAIVVTEHRGADGAKTAVTVAYHSREGYDARTGDWYWAYFLSDGTLAKSSVDKSPYNKRGFVTFEQDGRLWVFATDSADLAEFLAGGELAKHVIRPAAGPAKMTLKSPDAETIDAYLVAKSGFVTIIEDGRLWVFREGANELETVQAGGELAKHVIRPAAGPGGMTVKAPDNETIMDYLTSRDGFQVVVDGERLWVFRANSPELQEFKEKGEPAKCVIRPAAGPLGMTVKGPDAETIDAYLNS